MNSVQESIQEQPSSSLQFLQYDQIDSQSKIASLKTISPELYAQANFTVKQKKHLKNIKNRELKLMIENITSCKHIVPQRRKAVKKSIVQFDSDSPDIIQSPKKQKLNKKIKKTTNKIKHSQNSNCQDVTNQNWNYEASEIFKQNVNNTTKQKLGTFGSFLHKGLMIQNNVVKSQIGHSTLVFNDPIIQGSYYIQLKIVKPLLNLQFNRPSDIRIGICSANHKSDYPLGYKNSIGLSLSRKQIITQGKYQRLIQFGHQLQNIQFNFGDIIGFQLQFSPPHKNADPSKCWEQTNLSFYLNGKIFAKYQNVKQMIYHPAISFYNGACVQIRTKQHEMEYKPNKCQAYEKSKTFVNLYK